MERSSEVLGLPVIAFENGKKLGDIKDIVYCPKKREIKGFILENRGFDRRKRMLLFKDVLNIGKDAIIAQGPDCVVPVRESGAGEGTGDEGGILGLKIYSRSGENLGVVKDVLFDQKTGLVEGVEASDGLIQDIIQGRKLVPLFGKVEFGSETLLVDREAVEEAEETGGGIKKRLLGE